MTESKVKRIHYSASENDPDIYRAERARSARLRRRDVKLRAAGKRETNVAYRPTSLDDTLFFSRFVICEYHFRRLGQCLLDISLALSLFRVVSE